MTDAAAAQAAKIQELRDEFLKRDVTITGANGETRFAIAKMPATVGWDTLEEIREAMAEPLMLDSSGGVQAAMEKLLLALPKPFTRRLRNTMFGYVTYTNRIMQTPTTLAGTEESAFDAIEAEPLAIYNMLVRTLSVNFTDSFVELFEMISNLQISTGNPPNTGTSPRS